MAKKNKPNAEPFVPIPARKAPSSGLTIWVWMKNNLFSSWTSFLLTIISLLILVGVFLGVSDWVLFDATWIAENKDGCDRVGACWAFVGNKFFNFMYGFYPEKLYWRVNAVVIIFTLLFIPLVLKRFSTKFRIKYGIALLVGYPILGFFALLGNPGVVCNVNAPSAFCYVPVNKWGGVMMTLILSYVGVLASFPIGILLALGRMSRMPIIKSACITFIELWRGVPLITILFMASVVLPFFLPPGVELNKLMRALVGIVFFESAYMAEVIRGGIQAIPKGQHEAADTVGFTYRQKMSHIILPQALKIVLPSIVGTSISLVKDTSLVTIIGLFDVLAIAQVTATDPNWLGFDAEGYVFAAFLFWIFCYSMSRYSNYLEGRYSTVHK